MGDTSETNINVLSGELFLGVVALITPLQKNHCMHDMGPFPRYFFYLYGGHIKKKVNIFSYSYGCLQELYCVNKSNRPVEVSVQ